MSDQRVLDNLVDSRRAQNSSTSDGDSDQKRKRDMGMGDSIEDVLCFDRRTPLVNTALGLMGYQVPQVCDLMMRHWMDTVHVFLRDGSLTAPKLRRILENVDFALRELKGPLLLELIEALLKAAVHAKNMSPKSSIDNRTFVRTKSSEGSDAAWAVKKILEYVLKEKEVIYNHLSPISRLQVWRLRPSVLKTDLSDLANESMRRPLLSLKRESHSSRAFIVLVASLALAPDLLNEARRLLLTWSISVRAVRLLELRAQLTVAVHGILQYSIATGSATHDEGVSSHTMHCSRLRPLLQVLTGAPTISALSHLIGLMEGRESSERTSGNRPKEVPNCGRSPKRQRISYEIADQEEPLDNSLGVTNDTSRNMLGILRADKEAVGMRTETNVPFALDSRKTNLHATTSGILEGVHNSNLWASLADFLSWSTFASHLLFLHEDASAVSRKSAAEFLGWLMCPSSPQGRAYAITKILRAAEDWHSMCNEAKTIGTQTLRRPDGTRRLLDFKKKNGTENFPLTLCSICGSPVYCTEDCANDGLHHVSNSSMLHNLVAWLLQLCRLGSELQLLHLKGFKNVSKHQSYHDEMWRVIRLLPTASLASDPNCLIPQVGSLLLSMILLGLTSGSRGAPSKEEPSSPSSCCTVCDDFHCESCCSKDQHKSSEPPHRTEHIKDDARSEDDFNWVPFAAALFTHLETNFCPSGEPQILSSPTLDSKVTIRRVVASSVNHWVQLMSQSITSNSPNVEIMYHRRVQMLEDLQTRVITWADVTGAGAELAQSVGGLKLQIEQLKTFL